MGETEVQLRSFLTLVPDTSNRLISRSGLFTSRETAPLLPFHYDPGCALQPSSTFCRGQKPPALAGIRTPSHTTRRLVITLIALLRLTYYQHERFECLI